MGKSHEEKQFTQMAGEFGVVSELLRRQVQATITYGNSKSADVYVISREGNKAAKIEVKSSTMGSWLIGKQAGKPAPHKVWVFVLIPDPSVATSSAEYGEIAKSAARYYVLKSSEVSQMYEEKLAAAMDGKKAKDLLKPLTLDIDQVIADSDATAELEKQPIITFNKSDLQNHYQQWHIVTEALKAKS